MQNNLQSNIWKYTLFLIANKRIFAAILGAYYLTIPGVTASGIGIILLAGGLAGFILEIPSGYLSDKFGHKRALVFSRVCMLVSTLLFLLANDLYILMVASAFLAISFAFHSGTGSAFMHETLKALGKEKDYAKIMGKIRSVGFIIPAILSTSIPFLVAINFKAPFAVALIFDLLGLIVALSFVTPKISREKIKEIGAGNFKQILREGYNLGFIKFALLGGIIGGALFVVSAFRPAYQLFLGIPVIYYGIFFGIGRAITAILQAYSGQIKNLTTLKSFFGFKIILYFFLFLFLSLTTSWWAVILIFIIINAFQWGLDTVANSYYLDIIRDSSFKATLLSLPTQINKAVVILLSICFGLAVDLISYPVSFLLLAIIFLITLTPLYLLILKRK